MNTTNLPSGAASSESNDESLSLFRQQGEPRDCQPETELFSQGQPIRNVCLIERGLVKFTRMGKGGHEMLVALRLSGNLLGAAAAISNLAPQVAGVTLTECRLYCFSGDTFRNLVNTDTQFSRSVLRSVSRQLYDQMGRLARLGTTSARSRLAHLLLQFVPPSAYERGGEIRLQLPLSKADLARMIVVTPEYFSAKLRELEEMNIIRRSRGWVYVRDLATLIQEAG